MTDILRTHEAIAWLPLRDRTDLAVRYPWNRIAAHPATRTKSALGVACPAVPGSGA
jgi:hypothetical protein